ncbi:hypothetical protein ASG82_06660 [Mycobacterium sp. Soil538]|nr:hypothetical protein ASG82_06660 [Mycobacterium sp. Soil538]
MTTFDSHVAARTPGTVALVEDPTTPWLIAEATASAGLSAAWVWLTLALGAAVVLAGGFLIALI